MEQFIDKEKTLVSRFPDLAAEWHPKKNGELTPSSISSGSGKKVWWLCSKGHEWQATISNRTIMHSGCPYCANRKVLSGFNDLAFLRPDIAAEWHPSKNGDLKPSEVMCYSNKTVWWICPTCGNEYAARVADRSKGNGCPYCAGRKVMPGFNDLATTNPDLAAEWHPTKNGSLTPTDVTNGSNKKVWWRCSICGAEWQAQISNRVYGGTGCPECSAYLHTSFPEQAILYYLQKTFPDAEGRNNDLGFELDILIPSIKTAIEYDGAYYHREDREKGLPESEKDEQCRKKNITLFRIRENGLNPLSSSICIIRDNLSNTDLDKCISKLFDYLGISITANVDKDQTEILAQYRSLVRANSIQTKNPNLAIEWHPTKNGTLTPENLTIGSNKKVWWLCPTCHGEWQASVSNRIKGKGCPFCSGRNALRGFNDLATTNPELAAEWHPTRNGDLTSNDVTRGTQRKAWWLCKNGHEWQATIASRDHGNGCPYCSNKMVLPDVNDLATTNPDLASEWHPTKNGDLTPADVLRGSHRKVWWLCQKGHEWQATIDSRDQGSGCPYCGNKKVLVGFNDLATSCPELASEWHPTKNHGLLPTDVTSGSNKKVWWRCKNGHEWKTSVDTRHNNRSGCPYCAGQRVLIGINDLVTVNPDLASEWHPTKNGDLTPSDVARGSSKKVWWLCKNGHEWEAQVASRCLNHRGCPYCAGKRVLTGVNDLATTNPNLATEWHPTKNGTLTPSDVARGTNKEVWWVCSKGHEWRATINSRDRGNGCPYCSNKMVLSGFNDLATLRPDIAVEWHPTKNGDLKPNEVVPGSAKEVWWRCSICGAEWQQRIEGRARRNSVGCAECRRMLKKRCRNNVSD